MDRPRVYGNMLIDLKGISLIARIERKQKETRRKFIILYLKLKGDKAFIGRVLT